MNKWLRNLVFTISFMVMASISCILFSNKQAISESLVPKSILQSFKSTHSGAKDIEYVFNVDDSGISYLISFTQQNKRYTAEYNYSEWAQLEFDYARALDRKEYADDEEAGVRKTRF